MEDKNQMEDEIKKEFKKADKAFDVLEAKNRSKVELKKKVFMKLSDISPDDAEWFKDFCDRHTDKKQFLGIKVMRLVMERFEPFVGNLLSQIDQLNKRVDQLESVIAAMQVEEDVEPKMQIPKTMGSALKEEQK